MAAGGTAVVAEVPDVRSAVLVPRPAANAVLRVGRVLERRARAGGIVDAEHDGVGTVTRELAHQRIVAVQRERRVRRQGPDRLPPPGGDAPQLAVAVELVAEEIPEADGPRPQA